MYLLDTDHISLMDRRTAEGERIRARLAAVPPDNVNASIVSFEEQIRGWMSAIAQAGRVDQQILFYTELERLLRFYCITPLLPFDSRAAAQLQSLQKARIRIGTMDLKVASIALANDATLLTRNTKDFQKVPGLRFEDWSI